MEHQSRKKTNAYGALTPAQIRAARAMLRWPARVLAERSGVHITTVQRLEGSDEKLRGNLETAERVRAALEEAGVEFLPDHGIRLQD